MEQIVARIIPGIEDVELLIQDEKKYPKIININDYIDILKKYACSSSFREEKIIDLTDPNIFYLKQLSNGIDMYYYRFEERILHPSYNNNIFRHMHPNTVFILELKEDMLISIKAFIYKEWNGLDTKLYVYNLPNMLGENKICMGTINKKKEETILKTILKVIEGNYSADITKIKDKMKYDYDKCISLKYTIKKII